MATGHLPEPGEVFEQTYDVEAEVGTGGFSKVYRARRIDDNRVVALKILLPKDSQVQHLSYPGDLADRFAREAQVLSMLENPHSIALYDYGETSRGLLYMVFEYVEGRSLFAWIRDGGALEASRAVAILEQTLDALRAAHARGILHRDIKPNNIMLTRVGEREVVKLLDFGIAKAYGDARDALEGNELTAAGTLVGTPRYMAPEQLRGHSLTPAADLYALGVVALEMLTGRKAIAARDRVAVIEQQLAPESLTLDPRVQVPPRLKSIVDRMLAKNPRLRYSSAAQVIRDLQTWRRAPVNEEATILETVSDADLSHDGPTILETVDEASVHLQQTVERERPRLDRTVSTVVNVADLERAAGIRDEASDTSGTSGADDEATIAVTVRDEPSSGDRSQDFVTSAPESGAYPQARSGAYSQAQFGASSADSGTYPRAQSGSYSQPRSGSYPRAQRPATPQPKHDLRAFQRERPAGVSDQDSPNSDASGVLRAQDAFELNGREILTLVVSFFLPGLAHFTFGQSKKGAVLFASIFLSFGLVYFVSIALVFDAYLVRRAMATRDVADFEFFPDWK